MVTRSECCYVDRKIDGIAAHGPADLAADAAVDQELFISRSASVPVNVMFPATVDQATMKLSAPISMAPDPVMADSNRTTPPPRAVIVPVLSTLAWMFKNGRP